MAEAAREFEAWVVSPKPQHAFVGERIWTRYSPGGSLHCPGLDDEGCGRPTRSAAHRLCQRCRVRKRQRSSVRCRKCGGPYWALGLCQSHYEKMMRFKRQCRTCRRRFRRKSRNLDCTRCLYRQAKERGRLPSRRGRKEAPRRWRQCAIEGCTRWTQTWECSHHRNARRAAKAPRCQVPGCENKVYYTSFGLCSTHYQQRRRERMPPCEHPGCQRPAERRGLCSTHYGAAREARQPRCLVPHCTRPARAAGRCSGCYQYWRRTQTDRMLSSAA